MRWIPLAVAMGAAQFACKERTEQTKATPRPMVDKPPPDPSIKKTLVPMIEKVQKAANVTRYELPQSAPCKVPVLPFTDTTPISVDERMQFTLPAAARPTSPDSAATVLALDWEGTEYDMFGLAYSKVTFEQIDVATESMVARGSFEIPPLTSHTVDRDSFNRHNDQLRKKVAEYVGANCK